MHFYWINDRVKQGQFKVGCPPGDTNMGDYFTKHHSPAHNKRMKPYYLHIDAAIMINRESKSPVLRGCANICTISPASQPQPPTEKGPISASHRRPAEHTQIYSACHGHTHPWGAPKPPATEQVTHPKITITNLDAMIVSYLHNTHECNDDQLHIIPLPNKYGCRPLE
jgi:hypothetical protein